MTNKLKLYVWPNSLCDYTCGVLFALAKDKNQAKSLIRKAHKKKYWPSTLIELEREPEIYEQPTGFAVWGGG